jgi:uncharacterized RDD family membrane protein YckC
MTTTALNTSFYERKRRLAYYFAWASMIFMALFLSIGFLLEFYSHPRAAAAVDGLRVIHRAVNQDSASISNLLRLDADLKLQAEPLSLADPATALLPEGRNLTLFFGNHAALLVDGKISKSADLGQEWEVLCAVADPAGAWIFGWHKDQIVARRREKETWTAEIVVAKAAAVDRIAATRDGAAGPLVAWRERDTTKVKTALYDGNAFGTTSEFDIGAVEHWDVLLLAGRRLLVTYNRDDRTFRWVTLRLDCCTGCPAPIPPHKVAFADPALLLGRKVTGIATAVQGDRLRVFVTRTSALMAASLPVATLEPEPAAKLVPIGSESLWRHVGGTVAPLLLTFCSFSMIFLGLILFRERTRLARGIAADPKEPVDFFPRAMAWMLDHLLVSPIAVLFVEISNVAPDLSLLDFEDPNFHRVVLVLLGTFFLYYFLMEWLLGWTVGKWILGLKVTELDGSKLTLRGAFLRTLLRLFDSENILGALVGIACLLKTRRRQRLGDLAARTVVVVDRS